MDTAQWPQEIVVKPIEEIVTNTCPKPAAAVLERKARPQKEQALNCPRCNSTNTKFCYYNNYSLAQPRYFCKTCRRYWTEGGSLRNIPVGGGSRKNKRSTPSNSTPPHSKKFPDLVQPQHNPKTNQAQDLNLSFQSTHQDFNNNLSELVNNPTIAAAAPSSTTTSTSTQLSALELLTGMTNSRGLNSFIPTPVTDPSSVYTTGFPLHDQFKPSLNFSLDGLGNGFGNLQGVPAETSTNGRLLLPFEDLKQATASPTNGIEQSKEQGDSTGFWTGMFGGGSW